MLIESTAIIGATELGCKFAALSLRAGCRTILEDISISALERAAVVLEGLCNAKSGGAGPVGLTRSAIVPLMPEVTTTQEGAVKRLTLTHSIEGAIRDADLIIEAVADELEMKLELFTIFDKFAKPGSTFATTTTSLSIADLADMTFRPELCIGLRISPGRGDSGGLQVVRTTVTSDETVAACRELAQRMHLSFELLSPPVALG